MKIGTIELTPQEASALYEAVTVYNNAMASLKNRGVDHPERAAKSAVNLIEQNIETITETICFEGNSSLFASYFDAGHSIGATFEEIQEAFETKDERFLLESSFYNGVTNKINLLKSMGHKVHSVAVTSRNGVPHAEFTVVDKEHNRKRHIVHGNTTTVASLGKVREGDQDANDNGI